ncbi:MAG: alpha/beta fold hydrolase [Bacteroidia bacterium]
MTNFVKSKDGTQIATTRVGRGPHLVLVDGAFCHRKFGPNEALANQLKKDFTVTIYDRRGRGESGNTLPYKVEREIEDLEAIINSLDQSVSVYGISSGAALALEAANAGLPIHKLALYEAPFIVDDSRKPLRDDYLERLQTYTESGQNGKVVSSFMKDGVGLPGFVVFMMRLMPSWKKLRKLAPTVIYDTLILGETGTGKPLSADKWPGVKVETLVISGSKSEKWAQNSMKQLATVLPNANHLSLRGQTHMVKPKVLAPELIRFFSR